MRLARLLLRAFGPFTDAELDLGRADPSRPDLHLIYGPNEAGKSSALRAMTDLRFGIPQRSPDDFTHPFSQLRIGGVFEDEQGQPFGLMRRKGRGITLSALDPASGEPLDPPDVAPALVQALTAGLDRDGFEAMFGLNHERLRDGGRRLLRGEGDLGSALFEASAGTRGIAAVLAALEADAKTHFNPNTRDQSAAFNAARRVLDEQRQVWRQAQTRPAEWQALQRAHAQARDALAEIDRDLEAQRRRDNELTELRAVAPLLQAQDRAGAEVVALAAVPDLPEDAREQRLAALQALERAVQDRRDAQDEAERCTQALMALVIETQVLAQGEAIERLAAGLDALGHSRVEVERQAATCTRIEAELEQVAGRIAPPGCPGVNCAVPPPRRRIASPWTGTSPPSPGSGSAWPGSGPRPRASSRPRPRQSQRRPRTPRPAAPWAPPCAGPRGWGMSRAGSAISGATTTTWTASCTRPLRIWGSGTGRTCAWHGPCWRPRSPPPATPRPPCSRSPRAWRTRITG